MNYEDVIPIHQYCIDLQKEISDAEWLGDIQRADVAISELEHVKEMIDDGAIWYPMF